MNPFENKLKVHAKGENINRFLNLIIYNSLFISIEFKNECEMVFFINTKYYNKLIEIAEKYDIEIKIIERKGIQYIIKKISIWNIIAVIICIFGIYFANLFVFDIVIFPEGKIKSEIYKYLKQHGITSPTLKKNINEDRLENDLINNNDGILWIKVKIKGVMLFIEYQERKKYEVGEKVDKIIASESGIIDKIVLRSGKVLVDVGDTVVKGQVLVIGYEITKDGNKLQAIPDADIYAKTWYEVASEYIHQKEKKVIDKRIYLPEIYINNKNVVPIFLLQKLHKYDKIKVKEILLNFKIFKMVICLTKYEKYKTIKNQLNIENVINNLNAKCDKDFYSMIRSKDIISVDKQDKKVYINKKNNGIYRILIKKIYQCTENICSY